MNRLGGFSIGMRLDSLSCSWLMDIVMFGFVR